jgi:hypothetical protein
MNVVHFMDVFENFLERSAAPKFMVIAIQDICLEYSRRAGSALK